MPVFAAYRQPNGAIKEKSRSPQCAPSRALPSSPPQVQRRSAMPMRGELSIPAMRLPKLKEAKETRWSRFVSEITKPDFIVISCFCIIGLLIAACCMLMVPNFGELSEVLQQYP
jgi:hypothetical protein